MPEVPLAFTGERLTTAYGGQTEIEHLHRYLLAREWCRGKDVMDVASGEGYGAWMLAQVARSAVGVEIAQDAVDHATRAYPSANLRFLQGDARAIPVADASLDVVVSFETIEHFAEHAKFIAEVRRVLRPDGIFILSTPDRDNYSPSDTPANPYHVRELTGPEFERLLRAGFAHVGIVAQRPVFGSVILPPDGAAVPPLCYERRGARHFEGSHGLSRPQYYVAFASDVPVTGLTASVYIETGRLGMQCPAELEARAVQGEQNVQAQRALHMAEMESLRRQSDDDVQSLRASLAMADAEKLAGVAAELAAARDEVKGLIASNEMAERAVVVLRGEAVKAAAEAQSAQVSLRQFQADAASVIAAELEGCRARVASAEAALLLVHRSTSWRLTRPLRAASRAFLRRP